jgi:hypothetical protein
MEQQCHGNHARDRDDSARDSQFAANEHLGECCRKYDK